LVEVFHDAAGYTLLAGGIGVVDDIDPAGGFVPELPEILVSNGSKAVCLRHGEQVAGEAFWPAGVLGRDGAEREQDAQVWAEEEQAKKMGDVMIDHAPEFGQVSAGIL
jgi:hypothetical protein